ncbi:hypothetical protein BKA61DRAFT_669776 [Leptodontidium sp. MPI-SDFR-AT-0119]|nr:hypothetical protein BKA61DRAFT_669776 [Leptodontidium sp. MPI-SDFR-AT-0119]
MDDLPPTINLKSASPAAGGILPAGGPPGCVALLPQALQNNGQLQASSASTSTRPGLRISCASCRRAHQRCDLSDTQNPCSRCEKLRRPCIAPAPALGVRPSTQQPQPSIRTMAPLLGRTAQEQADFESRNRFDNSDSESDGESEGRIQLSLRGSWAAEETGPGSMMDPRFQIPAGETRTIGDVILAESKRKQQAAEYPAEEPAPRAAPRTEAEIAADEKVLLEDLEQVLNKYLPPVQVAQLMEDDPTTLPDWTGGPNATVIPSSSTPLTEVQLAAQEAISKNKNRRRPKKKAKSVEDTEIISIGESDDPSSSAPAISSAATSFQSLTIEDDADDEIETSTAASTPASRILPPKVGGESVITAKPSRKKGKKKNGRKAQKTSAEQDDGYLSDQGMRHYEDQPFLLCCQQMRVTHPVTNENNGKFMDLAKRIAGKFPDQLVVQAKNQYGVVWCDFPIVFGLAYHHKPSDTRGINWYGTDDWLSGEITEILVQAPEVVTRTEAPTIEGECLVRQPHGTEFACYGHTDHTFNLFEAQWQAQGEGKRREAIRKLCEFTEQDFATFLRLDRIKRGMNL